jgi:catechol 2,3-dioxygenase-like lactoylglutathione lyase family enzyme
MPREIVRGANGGWCSFEDRPDPSVTVGMTATCTNHICFNVVDIEKIHTDLTAQGIEFVTDPIITQGENRRHGIVYARDAEGNWLEFIE